jgi:acyl-CoA hydrolase
MNFNPANAQDAFKHLQDNAHVFIHTAAAVPQYLVNKLTEYGRNFQNIQIYQLHTEGLAPYAAPEFENNFHVNAFFIGKNIREAVKEGRGSYIPIFLSEIPQLFKKKIIDLDIAIISVSPPNQHGFCSLGVSVDTTLAAIENAKIVIAQVNEFMPRTHGFANIHISQIDYLIPYNMPIPEAEIEVISEIESKIGGHIANLIEDGATLQMGIGNIPNAVLKSLSNHKDLGIHTEMFSDGILPLVESGVITNKFKTRYRDRIVSTFIMGTRKLYDFVDDNPMVEVLGADYVNDTYVIASNPKVTAINSAIEVDITGQVCADSIGYKMYSGVGGQMDFIRGASLSKGGKAIIALPSVSGKGVSRISGHLNEGAGVVTTRAHVHYVVTEYGVANLYGKSLKQRASALIEIAHPDKRENLEQIAYNRFGKAFKKFI